MAAQESAFFSFLTADSCAATLSRFPKKRTPNRRLTKNEILFFFYNANRYVSFDHLSVLAVWNYNKKM